MIRDNSTKAQPTAKDRAKARGSKAEGRAFGLLLRSIDRAFLRGFQAGMAQYDIALHQYFVLRELWNEPGLNQRVLCARLNAHEPTMVATIGTLVDLGYVERSRNALDRRHSHLELTEDGRALARKLFRCAEAVNKRALAGMKQLEVSQLTSLLSRVESNLFPWVSEGGSRPDITRVDRVVNGRQ